MGSILLVLLVIIASVMFWAVGGYNQLVQLKNLVSEAWSGIDVQLKRRYDLIPNLVQTVKGYAQHEKSTFEQVTKMRSAAMGSTTIEEKAQAETGLTGALKSLFAVAEQYPELKANENFQSLQKELSNIEQELQLARRYYNGTARNYNVLVQKFPSKLIAQYTGFDKVPFFELDAESEREAPKVSF